MLPVAIAQTAMLAPGLLDWNALKNGTSAVVHLDKTMSVPIGAPVPLNPSKPDDWPFAFMPRAVSLALEVLNALPRDPDRRYGMVLGMPNLFSETDYMEHTLRHRNDPTAMEDVLGYSYDFPLAWLAKKAGGNGPLLRVDSACATGNDALIAAHQWLAHGLVDDVLVVACSAMLNPVGLALFHNLKALNDLDDLSASRPFDRDRRGFVMGEGAAAAWLTNHPPDKPRGYLCGYGQSLNADKFVDLPADLSPMIRACRQAMGDVKEIAWVCAPGTGTPANDVAETKLCHQLFGSMAAKTPISSIKSMIGHCLGAAALIEAIVCLEALNDGMAPPTINLTQPDPACDLNYVPHKAQPIHGNYVLSNAFAFGGQNSVILLSREQQ